MRHGEFGHVLPDVIPSGDGRFVRKRWSYGQGWRGVRLPDSYLVTFDGARLGGGPGEDCPEAVWAIRYPLDIYESPTFHRLWDPDRPGEHENYRPSMIRTPASWPQEKRWLAAYTGTMHTADGVPRNAAGMLLRQHVGFAWATDPLGPWDHKHRGIPASNTNPKAPAGVWASALLVVGERVLLVVRDASVVGQKHEVYEIAADLTYQRIGVLALPAGLPWDTDMSDVMMGGSMLYALAEPARGAPKVITEWCTDLVGAWPETLTMRPSGRVFSHPDPSRGVFDAGYMREPDGSIASPGETVFANVEPIGKVAPSGMTQVGGSWGCYWTSLPSPILERAPLAVEVVP